MRINKATRYAALFKITYFLSRGRCCINRARSVDVYAQRSRGSAPYQVRFESNCLIFAKKMRKDIHKTGESKPHYHVRNWAAYNEGLINQKA
ncbi:MAG: hypothetical protein V3Q69_09645 [Burkholderia sp.]